MKASFQAHRPSHLWSVTILLGAVFAGAPREAAADVAPPVEIKMAVDTPRAVSGREYSGVFLVHVYEPGTLANFELSGKGWTVLALAAPTQPTRAEPGLLEIPFRAVPSNADSPIALTLTYNGRRVARSYEIGPAYFARAGKPYRAVRVRESSIDAPTAPKPPGKERPAGGSSANRAGGRSPLQVVGRIVFTRPCRDLSNPADGDCDDPVDLPQVVVGVDNIDVRVLDDDGLAGSEEIWSGYTDENGYFDTGPLNWDDGGDLPDLVLWFETQTAGVADVTDNSIAEWTYVWTTPEITDFGGSFYDYGWVSPTDSSQWPALQIFNSIVRTRRFITSRSSYVPPLVQVEWPDDSRSGKGAWYEYWTTEIHISSEREWRNDTHTHEYGHHFMYSYSSPPATDYCNSMCDPDPPDQCGHCMWCAENDHDAWNEGWPHWLADAVTRSYPQDYQHDDGSPFQPLYTRSMETPQQCNGSFFDDALTTEGFIGALLRDIEDGTQDDHDGDGIMDTLCLGANELFDIQAIYDPINVLGFIAAFRTQYPQYADELWPTAYNVDPAFVSGYPADAAPPGAVQWCDSPTHPLGVGDSLPCIIVEWQPAPDDVSGACAYSYEWGTNPSGIEPDTIAEADVDLSGCLATISTAPQYLGDYYISIKARDCAGNWGTQWSTFGPFTVTDCNSNGTLDACEVTCDLSSQGLACAVGPPFCAFYQDCGMYPDCNTNLVPDDCDIAAGTSADCNFDAVPDECQNMVHWTGGNGSWLSGANWDTATPPVPGELVCINVPGDVTVSYTEDATTVTELSCHENLDIQGSVFPFIAFTIVQPSFVLGNLAFGGTNASLTVDGALDVGGLFDWSGGTLTGAGTTDLNGGVQLGAVVYLNGHHLALSNFSTGFSGGNWMVLGGGATFQVRPGATYDHQGGGTFIFSGWFGDTIDNDGTIVKSAGAGSSLIDVFTDNTGLIHAQSGTLILGRGSSSTGQFLGDPGTVIEFRGGGHEFLAGSSIVAESVTFTSGVSGNNNVWGTYNVSGSTSVIVGQPLYFKPGANIVSYGADLTISGGPVYFDTVLGAPVSFNSITITANTTYFNSGDPINAVTLDLGPGGIRGPSDVTVSGLMTWNPGGWLMGPSTINADGGLLITAGGAAKTLYDRTFNNAATATILGSFGMSGSSQFNNLATGVMDIQVDGNIVDFGTLNNAGTIVKTAGAGTSTITANATNTGLVEIQTGTLEFYTNYGLFYVQSAGQTLLNGGNLSMFGPAPVQIDGGLLTGAGTITGNVNNAGGSAEPGLSAGTLVVSGTYTQAPAAALKAEIGGLAQDAEYDLLAVAANATLAGKLEAVFTNGFVPSIGDTFQILTAATVSGTFDNVVMTNLPANLAMKVIYTATDVTLAIVDAVPGDCDRDGDVDLADFGGFDACLQGPAGGLGGGCDCFDADSDNDVDLYDFAVFTANFTGS